MSSPAPIHGAVPWADLPPELCGLVMDRLDAFSILRFPAVCKSWATAYKADPRRLRPGALTLLTSVPGDGSDKKTLGTFALHDLFTGRCFRAAAEGLKNKGWIGGKGNWLVTTDANFRNVELLNPASGNTIRLPSFNTIPGATLEKDGALHVAPRSYHRLRHVVLCRTPAHRSGYLAVARFVSLLAFTAAGDECWTALVNHIEGLIIYADAMAHAGKIFGVSLRGDVYYWDMDGGTQDPQVVRVPEMPIDRWRDCLQQRRFSLATSPSGHLLLVCTHGDRPDGRHVKRMVGSKQWRIHRRGFFFRARGVLLHELDVGRRMWRRVPDLSGDLALFVGMNSLYAFVPPRGSDDDDELRANCVYTADVSGYDAVVFDLEKGCTGGFEPLLRAGVDWPFPLHNPIWFRPAAHW